MFMDCPSYNTFSPLCVYNRNIKTQTSIRNPRCIFNSPK